MINKFWFFMQVLILFFYVVFQYWIHNEEWRAIKNYDYVNFKVKWFILYRFLVFKFFNGRLDGLIPYPSSLRCLIYPLIAFHFGSWSQVLLLPFDLLLTTYDIALMDQCFLSQIPWHYVVIYLKLKGLKTLPV